jgi:ABC-type polysaccharide/polyol phosphate export permease
VNAAAPPPELRFRRRVRLGASLRELWRARELVFSLAERDLRARYKQAVLGFSWAVVTPLLLMVAFSLVFPRVAKVDTGGVPYPLFSYLGLGMLFVLFSFAPQPESYWVPVLLAVQVVFTLGVTMALSGIMVYVRDIRHLLPIALQLGLFATPVAFSLDQLVPAGLQPVYVALNPLGGVIDGYRQTVLYGQQPDMQLLSIAAISATVMFLAAYALFKRLETGFADVA